MGKEPEIARGWSEREFREANEERLRLLDQKYGGEEYNEERLAWLSEAVDHYLEENFHDPVNDRLEELEELVEKATQE